MNKIARFFDSIKYKKVAFIGMGVTNLNCIKMFLNKGINVTICDKKSPEQLGENYKVLQDMGAKYILGENYLEALYNFDIVFRTPGMYYNNPILQDIRKRGIVVTSEMEMFFELCPCKIYAVTGSDGKTTTTTLISEFLSAEGKVVYKGGNIGRALLPIVEQIGTDDVAVVELSSFQLLSMRKSPDVAVITNVAPNHLDVHGTMEEYIDAKKNLIAHQSAFSKAVLNQDNEITNSLSDMVRGKLVKFSRTQKVECGAFLNSDGYLCYNNFGKVIEIMHMSQIKIPGIHNVENYLAAISAVWGEVSIENMVKVAQTFNGVEHRIEFVRELDGVKYYNDSIATSPTRVLAGLNSFNQKLVVIAGGYDKKIPFEPLAKPMNEKVKDLILLGVTADKIEKAVTNCEEYKSSGLTIHRVATLEEAVSKAREIAKSGDIVTLSPACASFDQYPNFEARGVHFKNIVNSLT
ncbi:MAG: UDP-N-acetylmuramoyl-L-alanine--D-glutamate ligase [Oscillospiraceae bacterium]